MRATLADMDVLARLLDATPPTAPTLRAWWDATASARREFATPVERALVGGALADRLGFAFAGGYAEALRALVPSLDGIAALCATEEGGAHPRAIRTALVTAGPGRYTVTGKKKWATTAGDAATLLVVASTGEEAGKNRLRVVRIPTSAPGVRIRSSPAPFVPEIEHAEIDLDGVAVTEADLLPGDGYSEYLKPFRTIEDLHVHAALAGYLVGVSRRRGLPTVEPLLALAATTRALAGCDPKAPSTHLALAGLIDLASRVVAEVERAWSAAPDDEWQRWQRDRALLQVASKARSARLEAARAALARS